MWNELVKGLAGFSSAVVTGIDAQGYPFSARCTPCEDHTRQVLLVQLPTEATIQPGPAGLLCHYHDELLWNLRILNIRGRLEHEANGWYFIPCK